MLRIKIDEHLPKVLRHVATPVALIDDQGNVIGHFVPKYTVDDFETFGPEPTPEELDRIASAPGKRYSTEEVVAHLRGLK
jgi:hypothetical protein